MKIKKEHLDAIDLAIGTMSADKIEKHRAFITAEGKAKDIEKRLRWDLLSATLGSGWICREIYPYANDEHLDTALRNAMGKIKLA